MTDHMTGPEMSTMDTPFRMPGTRRMLAEPMPIGTAGREAASTAEQRTSSHRPETRSHHGRVSETDEEHEMYPNRAGTNVNAATNVSRAAPAGTDVWVNAIRLGSVAVPVADSESDWTEDENNRKVVPTDGNVRIVDITECEVNVGFAVPAMAGKKRDAPQDHHPTVKIRIVGAYSDAQGRPR
ncbi:hypothetical protein MaudCBS49596_006094 [Microsporum audouinii]